VSLDKSPNKNGPVSDVHAFLYSGLERLKKGDIKKPPDLMLLGSFVN